MTIPRYLSDLHRNLDNCRRSLILANKFLNHDLHEQLQSLSESQQQREADAREFGMRMNAMLEVMVESVDRRQKEAEAG